MILIQKSRHMAHRMVSFLTILVISLFMFNSVTGQTQEVAQIDVNQFGAIVAGGTYGFLKVWDEDGILVADLSSKVPADHHVLTVAWDPSGIRFATGGTDGLIRIWDLNIGNNPVATFSQDVGITSVDWYPDGTKLAGVSGPGEYDVYIWDTANYNSLPIVKVRAGEVEQVKWQPTSGSKLVVSHLNAGVLVFDENLTVPPGTRALDLLLHGSVSPRGVSGVAWNNDGTKIAAGHNDGLIEIWNVNTPNNPIMQLVGHSRWVPALAWNPDGRLASYSTDGTVRIWNSNTGGLIHTYTLNRDTIVSNISWTADGSKLVYADDTLEPVIVTPPQITATDIVLRIDVGGGGATVTDGGPNWAADTCESPHVYTGNGSSCPNTTNSILLPNGVPLEVMQHYRQSSANLTWGIEDRPEGWYEVRLFFNENLVTGPDLRQFDVIIEGVTYAGDFDVYAAADGQDKGIMRSYLTYVDDGVLNLRINQVTGNTMLNGIELRTADPDALYRLNVGGEQILSLDGSSPYWMEDNDANETPFDTWPHGNLFGTASGSVTLTQSVPSYVPLDVFETHRFGKTNMYNDFPVPTGTYIVRLYLSEPEFNSAGQREMNFGIDNDVAQYDFDVYAEAGGMNTGIMREYTAYISDGTLDIFMWAPSPIDSNPTSRGVLQGVEIIPQNLLTLIQDIQVTGSSATYTWDPDAHAGDTVYTDWSYEFVTVPSELDGSEYIRTPNNDKLLGCIGPDNPQGCTPYELSFNLTAPATVYVAYDSRQSGTPGWALPDWLSAANGWTYESGIVVVTEDNQGQGNINFPRDVYSKSFPAGQVVLGGNNSFTASSTMYIIFAVPE